MPRILDRISNSFTWRRGVLIVATIAIALVLVERDRRLRAWHDEVATATASFVAAEGDPTIWAVPGAEVVVRDAAAAVNELAPPRRVGQVRPIEGEETSLCSVVVTGVDGGRVELTWAGRPPRLVGMIRLPRGLPAGSSTSSSASPSAPSTDPSTPEGHS